MPKKRPCTSKWWNRNCAAWKTKSTLCWTISSRQKPSQRSWRIGAAQRRRRKSILQVRNMFSGLLYWLFVLLCLLLGSLDWMRGCYGTFFFLHSLLYRPLLVSATLFTLVFYSSYSLGAPLSTGSWAFSASQLDLAEAEIQDCNVIIEELSGEIADRDDELEQLDK